MPASSALRSSFLRSSFRTPPCILSARIVATSTTASGVEPGLAALDVDELLAAEVGAEAGFRHHVVGELQGGRGGEHRVAAVRDVGERTTVDERRRTLQRLHQVGGERLLQEHRHGAVGVEIARADRLAVAGVGHDDVAEPLLEVVEVLGQAEDRHHLGGHGDVEAGLARIAVGDAAERADDLAQRAVVHVHDAAPGDAATVDAEVVAPVDVVVDHRRQEIVRRRDGVEVAGEMEVDVLHRHDLGVAAASGAALHAERRPERRLAQAQHRLLADVVEGVGEADRGRGLALAGGRRRDRRDQDQLAVRLRAERLDVVHRHLGLVVAVGLEVLGRDAELFPGDVEDRPLVGGLGDFDVRLGGLVLGGGHVKIRGLADCLWGLSGRGSGPWHSRQPGLDSRIRYARVLEGRRSVNSESLDVEAARAIRHPRGASDASLDG